jgi:hypothetical protein
LRVEEWNSGIAARNDGPRSARGMARCSVGTGGDARSTPGQMEELA